MKTSSFSVVVTFLALGLMSTSGCGPADPEALKPEGAGEIGTARAALQHGQTVKIQAVHSSKCFDVENASMSNEAPIQQWDCWGGGNQAFQARWNSADNTWQFIATHSGKCLDVWGSGNWNGTPLQQVDCHGGGNQKFYLEYVIADQYRIRPAYINKCLDVSGYSVSNGARVHL